LTEGARLDQAGPKQDSGPDGLLVVDKPEGLTSHDVVARVRRIAGTRRIGHTGTLDPMATGVLVLCLGKATRLVPYIEETGGAAAKAYEASIRFGFETTTDDREGEARAEPVPTAALDAAKVAAALGSFVGELDQVPPAFSAKKVDGQRAYAMARRGLETDLKPVRVQVGSAELLEFAGSVARVRFECSRGTYIRALARDLGRALGVGAHLVALRRTRSGTASLAAAVRLEDLTPDSLAANLVPMMPVLETWPCVIAGEREVADLRQGRAVTLRAGSGPIPGRVRIGDAAGRLVALATAAGTRVQPFCVF
jgi:tRNA pseudouridine55 synthase